MGRRLTPLKTRQGCRPQDLSTATKKMALRWWCKLNFVYLSIIIISTSGFTNAEHVCAKGVETPGYTYPNGDIEIEYGQPLNITCVLKDSNEWVKKNLFHNNASSALVFKRNGEPLPQDMITIVNRTSIRLDVMVPPTVSRDVYTCAVKTENGDKVVCINTVTVGVKPQPVQDFDCIGYNYDNLTCSWTPPENYVETNYSLQVVLKGRASRNGPHCPHLIMPSPDDVNKKISCFWNSTTTPSYRKVFEEFFFILTMTNKFGTNTLNKTFYHFSNILSGPPENLTLLSTTPSSAYLYWTIPTSMVAFPNGVHSRVLYQCVDDKNWHLAGVITDTQRTKAKEFYYNVTGLKYAHYYCDVRVSLRVADATEERMWSRNATLTILTSSKIPDGPPNTTVGCFEIAMSASDIQTREAYIYWQQIREVEKNGEQFTYEISVDGRPNLRPVEMTGSYAKFIGLSISESFKFSIWSKNKVGKSLGISTVSLPKQIDRIAEPSSFTKVEFDDGRFELSWEPPKLLPGVVITNYTIFRCMHNKDRPHQCTGKLNWTIVPSDSRLHVEYVDNKSKIYQFAISANTHNSSSGMLWAACTVLHNKTVGKIKNENLMIARVGSTFIQVGWKLDCSDRVGSVDGFIIYYCPIVSPMETQCKEPQRNVTFFGSGLDRGNITDLTPYTTYMLNVAVITKYLTFSQPSDPLFNTTLEAAPSTPPDNFIATDITNSSVTLRWDPPPKLNGILRFYVIEVYDVHADRMLLPSTKIEKETTYYLSNLKSYRNYRISIRACTSSCSEDKTIEISTKMGYPSQIKPPSIVSQNTSYMTIGWSEPSEPAGENNYYQLRIVEKVHDENVTFPIINVTGTKYNMKNCGEDRKYNTFYISVRAVNIKNGVAYPGKWSEDLTSSCRTSASYILWILPVIIIAFLVAMICLFKRLYKWCKIMRDVEVKLPPGLAPAVIDHTLGSWSSEKHQPEDRDSHTPADEQYPLVKIDSRHLSGDSSGCSSGQESVTSSLESAGHISTTSSDSGTEQPPGNYCVLGVNPKAASDSEYVPVAVNQDNKMSPYISCDVAPQSSPYVVAGEPVKAINPGYIPFNQNETMGKSSGYVVAGVKTNGYIPFSQKNCKLD